MKKILLLTLSLIAICSTQVQLNADTTPTQTDLSNFQDAIMKGNLSQVAEILDKYQNDSKPNAIVNHPLRCGLVRSVGGDLSPLKCAIINRYGANKSVNDIVKVLIKYGANINNKDLRVNPFTPLMQAVMNGYDDVVKTLVDAKANVNVIVINSNLLLELPNFSPMTAMDLAIMNKNVNMPTADIAESIITTLKNAGAKTGAELNK